MPETGVGVGDEHVPRRREGIYLEELYIASVGEGQDCE